MNPVQGKVAKDEADLGGIPLQHLLDHRLRAPAVGALVVAELDDGDRGVVRPQGGALRLYFDSRDIEVDLDRGLCPERLNVLLPRGVLTLLLEMPLDLGLHLFEGDLPHAFLVLLVEGEQLLIADARLLFGLLSNQLVRRESQRRRCLLQQPLVDHVVQDPGPKLVELGRLPVVGGLVEQLLLDPRVDFRQRDGLTIDVGGRGRVIGFALIGPGGLLRRASKGECEHRNADREPGSKGHGVSWSCSRAEGRREVLYWRRDR